MALLVPDLRVRASSRFVSHALAPSRPELSTMMRRLTPPPAPVANDRVDGAPQRRACGPRAGSDLPAGRERRFPGLRRPTRVHPAALGVHEGEVAFGGGAAGVGS